MIDSNRVNTLTWRWRRDLPSSVSQPPSVWSVNESGERPDVRLDSPPAIIDRGGALLVTLIVNTGLRWSEQARLGGLTWTCLPGASQQEWSGPACAAQHHRSRGSHGFGDAAPPPD